MLTSRAANAAAAAAARRLPQPGEGPSRDLMLNGYWKHTMIGLTETAAGEAPQVGGVVGGGGHSCDTCYWGTARMVFTVMLCSVRWLPRPVLLSLYCAIRG